MSCIMNNKYAGMRYTSETLRISMTSFYLCTKQCSQNGQLLLSSFLPVGINFYEVSETIIFTCCATHKVKKLGKSREHKTSSVYLEHDKDGNYTNKMITMTIKMIYSNNQTNNTNNANDYNNGKDDNNDNDDDQAKRITNITLSLISMIMITTVLLQMLMISTITMWIWPCKAIMKIIITLVNMRWFIMYVLSINHLVSMTWRH